MAPYQPLKITGMASGLIQNREDFLLPNDAYPVLQNAYVWRERILRKQGYQFLGRLKRLLMNANFGVTGASPWSFNVFTQISPAITEPTATVSAAAFVFGGITFTDNGNGTLSSTTPGNSGMINYVTGAVVLTHTAGTGIAVTGQLNYYPGLPVMGIRTRELQNSANDQTVFFDQKYAYIFNSSNDEFQEFIPGTTWNAAGLDISGTDFFWTTNYWTGSIPPFPSMSSDAGNKLFWVTNGSGGESGGGDPPRITGGFTWLDFTSGTWNRIDATNSLYNWLCNLPFRGRMVVFNTYEGLTAGGAGSAQNYSNRIRWSTIGNPFIPYSAGPPATGSWRDDIRGQGGFLNIPTSEDIISVGFVRDNLVIYCERSTWQLRYTGRAIAPFQVEKVNSELGIESTFSSVQFDTSLVGIGDKGIVECDSYKSERIDIKIPDFVFNFNSMNNGVARIQGIRNFPNKLAFWTIPLVAFYPNIVNTNWIFPTARLVYNYENDSWAIFNDSLTALGNYQQQRNITWLQIPENWIQYEGTWLDDDLEDPFICGGNQQGFIEILDQNTVNDPSLYISNIVNNGSGIAQVTSSNHNMQSGFVIGISGIPASTPFSDLNAGVYSIVVIDANNFTLRSFNSATNKFDIPVVGSPAGTYIGMGVINIRENFYVNSKKFNFMDEGQNIQMGYLDILMQAIQNGEISLYVYLNYDDETPSNTLSNNQIPGSSPEEPDTFFNTVIPMSPSSFAVAPQGTKFWQRVYCPTRANFLTLQYTFSDLQMSAELQQQQVQIDAQVLWIRKAGRMWQG
jgi:hypothetical protein